MHVLIEFNCIADHCISPKSVLHVQSISEWAPACIGPYSQASMVSFFLFLLCIVFDCNMNRSGRWICANGRNYRPLPCNNERGATRS